MALIFFENEQQTFPYVNTDSSKMVSFLYLVGQRFIFFKNKNDVKNKEKGLKHFQNYPLPEIWTSKDTLKR